MMNEQEGQAMKHADEIDDDPDELEEEIDWYEPTGESLGFRCS